MSGLGIPDKYPDVGIGEEGGFSEGGEGMGEEEIQRREKNGNRVK